MALPGHGNYRTMVNDIFCDLLPGFGADDAHDAIFIFRFDELLLFKPDFTDVVSNCYCGHRQFKPHVAKFLACVINFWMARYPHLGPVRIEARNIIFDFGPDQMRVKHNMQSSYSSTNHLDFRVAGEDVHNSDLHKLHRPLAFTFWPATGLLLLELDLELFEVSAAMI